MHTTQGRLYYALWKGNLDVLDLKSENPKVPLGVKEITSSLNQSEEKAKLVSPNSPVFVMVRDFSNPVSSEKYLKILSVLNSHLESKPIVLTPREVGFIEYDSIAPTIEIVFFPVCGIDVDEVFKIVKKAVYIPTSGAKKDMFRMSAHGVIFNAGKAL